MASVHKTVHSHSRNVAKSTTITYQTTRRVCFRWKRRFSAEHFHVMETILLPPAKVCIRLFNSFCTCFVELFFFSFLRFLSPLSNTMTDSVIRVHDSSTPQYKRVNEIVAKNINWCILDVGFSPNGQYFAYSTWSSSSEYSFRLTLSPRNSTLTRISHLIFFFFQLVYLSHIEGDALQLEALSLHPTKPNFCIFSVAFSNCGQQIIGGGSDGGLYIYDLTANRNTYQVPVETDTIDVNAVGFVDDTSNIMYSGADNGRIKASECEILVRHQDLKMTQIFDYRFGIVEH